MVENSRVYFADVYPSTQYRCDKVALRTTCIKNVKCKLGFLYNSKNIKRTPQNFYLGCSLHAGYRLAIAALKLNAKQT